MARTKEEYTYVAWCSFCIPGMARKWLGRFRENYGMDFQSVLALALEIGMEQGVGDEIERTLNANWQTAKVQKGMHGRMRAMPFDTPAKLQDIGAALLDTARPVMEDKEQLRAFINGREWPDGFKLTAQVENLAEQLGKLIDWETQGVE